MILHTFPDEELLEYADYAVMLAYFGRGKASGNPVPDSSQCVGFRKPSFLGGKDEMDNLELSDMSVYLELFAQMWEKVRNLPSGTRVNFSIS